jgi:hypothetical protein
LLRTNRTAWTDMPKVEAMSLWGTPVSRI